MSHNRKSIRRSQEKKRDRELKSHLKKLQSVGAYSPKGDELTRYRRARIKKAWAEYGPLIENPDVLFLKPPSHIEKDRQQKIIKRANLLSMKTTKTGIFYEKEGQRRGKITFNKDLEEYQIELSGKRKYGTYAGKRIKQFVPLMSIDALTDERMRIHKMASMLGRPGPNKRMIFRVTEQGNEGISHDYFSDADQIIKRLDEYKKSPAARIHFYRHIAVEIVTVDKHLSELKASRERRLRNKSRRKPK